MTDKTEMCKWFLFLERIVSTAGLCWLFPFSTYVVQVAVQIWSAYARARAHITIFERKISISLERFIFFMALQALHAQSSSHTFCLSLCRWSFGTHSQFASSSFHSWNCAKTPAQRVRLAPPNCAICLIIVCLIFGYILFAHVFSASCFDQPKHSSDMNINKNQTNCMYLIHVFVFTWFVCNWFLFAFVLAINRYTKNSIARICCETILMWNYSNKPMPNVCEISAKYLYRYALQRFIPLSTLHSVQHNFYKHLQSPLPATTVKKLRMVIPFVNRNDEKMTWRLFHYFLTIYCRL